MLSVLVDAGPLVALVSGRDEHHDQCVAEFRSLQAPLLTTWPVLAEAAWLVQADEEAVAALFAAGRQGLYRLASMENDSLPWLQKFLAKYRSLKAQLADATLAYLAEHEGIDTVFTLDRRDFSVYRFGKNRAFKILPE